MIPKVSFFIDHGMPVHGVIHAGAGDGEEIPGYRTLGIQNIICFEPLTSAYDALVAAYPDVKAYKLGLSDVDKSATLNVTAGDGKGSSLLEVIKDHPEVVEKWNHGQADVIGKERINLVRFDRWFTKYQRDYGLKLSDYNCLVLDTQGNEMDALEGFGNYLNNFDYLMVELSETPVYVSEVPGPEIAAWLTQHGFEQLTPIMPHDDVMFRRVK